MDGRILMVLGEIVKNEASEGAGRGAWSGPGPSIAGASRGRLRDGRLFCDDRVEVSLDQPLEHGSVLSLHPVFQGAIVVWGGAEVLVGAALRVNDAPPKEELSGDEGALQPGVLRLNVKALILIGDGVVVSRKHGQPMLENEREVRSFLPKSEEDRDPEGRTYQSIRPND